MTQLSKMNFIGKGIVLPVDWRQPGPQFKDAFIPEDRSVLANPPLTLFKSATLNRLHVETAKTLSDDFADYIEKMSAAVCGAISIWMKQASVSGVIINGPVGMLLPGSVKGPPIMPLILSKAPQKTPIEAKYSQAIAKAVGDAWMQWSVGFCGTLQYPLFAAVPSPVAPPTPNIPLPLIAFSSPGEAQLAPSVLSKAMLIHFGDPSAAHCSHLFAALAHGLHTVFTLFKSSTLVQNVLGSGPVPIFAPPFVPVGPVVGGVGNSTSGSFM